MDGKADAAVVLHALRGRIRAHLPAWSGRGRRQLETRLRRVEGVRQVEANSLTRNVLICFDHRVVDQPALLEALHAGQREAEGVATDEPAPPPVLQDKPEGTRRRARIPVR